MTTQTPHDGSYEALFSFPEMMRDLLQGFVDADWVGQLDLDSLEPVSGQYVSDKLVERNDDLVWRVRLRYHLLDAHRIAQAARAAGRALRCPGGGVHGVGEPGRGQAAGIGRE